MPTLIETAPAVTTEAPSEFLSITQAAAFAGVAPVTTRRWIKQRLLPAYRAGGQIRIDKADLLRFIRKY